MTNILWPKTTFTSISFLVHIVSFKQLHLKLSWDILYLFTFFENYLDVSLLQTTSKLEGIYQSFYFDK